MTSGAHKRLGTARPSRCDRTIRAQWSLEPGDTASVPRVRHRIMAVLRQDAPDGADLWSAELVIAELLSNAVIHTGGRVFVSLQWDGEHPSLSVARLGPATAEPSGRSNADDVISRRPAPIPGIPVEWQASRLDWQASLPADLMAESGRGLYLVSRLALDVEVAPWAAGGSRVSVTLDVARTA